MFPKQRSNLEVYILYRLEVYILYSLYINIWFNDRMTKHETVECST